MFEQLLVKINPPPTFAVKRIRYVKLCLGISLRWVCALPFVASRTKLLTPEEAESGIELLLVDLVSAGGDLSTGCDFFESTRLRGIDPDNERSVCDRESEPDDFNDSGLHLMHLERTTMRLRW